MAAAVAPAPPPLETGTAGIPPRLALRAQLLEAGGCSVNMAASSSFDLHATSGQGVNEGRSNGGWGPGCVCAATRWEVTAAVDASAANRARCARVAADAMALAGERIATICTVYCGVGRDESNLLAMFAQCNHHVLTYRRSGPFPLALRHPSVPALSRHIAVSVKHL